MNDLPDGMPSVVTGIRPKRVTYQGDIMKRDKWSEYLWFAMACSIFLFNIAAGLSFCADLWYDNWHYVKHVTTIVTMFASYIALIWTHKNILRRDD